MSSINILDSSVYNRIAAGEVIGGPSSVVKELVENAVDASAKIVIIDLKQGGTQLIRVTDNGSGMAKDDLAKAFLPHATSKIKELSDLDRIGTLGFRGEALPSIASVARVTFTSRTHGSALGSFVTLENGVLLDSGEAGCPLGSSVKAENLFKNIPARQKFLKRTAALEAEVCDLVLRLILANPEVSIKLNVDSKTVYHSAGEGLKSAVYAVYGAEFLSQSRYVEAESGGVKIYGYVSKPAYSKHNRSFQTLVVNNRAVVNVDISYWVYDFYSSVLMKRQYPFYVLNIELPCDMVDVNVHPNKLEVKFADFAGIKALLYKALEQNSAAAFLTPKPVGRDMQAPSVAERTSILYTEKNDRSAQHSEEFKEGKSDRKDTKSQFTSSEQSSSVAPPDQPRMPLKIVSSFRKSLPDAGVVRERPDFLNVLEKLDLPVGVQTAIGENSEADRETAACDNAFSGQTNRVAGKVFNTYIIVESGESLYFIDQHAAHERILYDSYKEKIDRGDVAVQNLLLPYTFQLSPVDSERLASRLADFAALGFEIDLFGTNSFCLRGVPARFADMRLDEFISSLFTFLAKPNAASSEFIKESLMQAACKAAVKGEMPLSGEEIDSLLRRMKQTKALFCPHGRPIVTEISKKEIEKWFKRII